MEKPNGGGMFSAYGGNGHPVYPGGTVKAVLDSFIFDVQCLALSFHCHA